AAAGSARVDPGAVEAVGGQPLVDRGTTAHQGLQQQRCCVVAGCDHRECRLAQLELGAVPELVDQRAIVAVAERVGPGDHGVEPEHAAVELVECHREDRQLDHRCGGEQLVGADVRTATGGQVPYIDPGATANAGGERVEATFELGVP